MENRLLCITEALITLKYSHTIKWEQMEHRRDTDSISLTAKILQKVIQEVKVINMNRT